MSDYIANKEDLLSTSPLTENFKKVYEEKNKALELQEKILNNEIKKDKLSNENKKLLEKYAGIEYDALLGAAAFDIDPEHSKFKVISWDEKTGKAILRDEIEDKYAVHSEGEAIRIEVEIKLIKSNGKWLIDDVK